MSFNAVRQALSLRSSTQSVLSMLPGVRLYEATFIAGEDQRVPPVFTTALRGALLRSLKEIVCHAPERRTCAACPHAQRCAYPPLIEPRDGAAREVPSPLVLRPVHPAAGTHPHLVRRADPVRVRIAFIGEAGQEHVSLVRAALSGVARRGLGTKPRSRARRPALELLSFERVETALPSRAKTWMLSFDTPCRITVDGKPAAAPTAASLWNAVVRRTRLLSALYGKGTPSLPFTAPWAVEGVFTRTVAVHRYSERQRRRITWSGFVGRARLRAIEVSDLTAELLHFIEQVQLGKGTQFGLGAVRVEAEEEHRP